MYNNTCIKLLIFINNVVVHFWMDVFFFFNKYNELNNNYF
jgi:hypothetical protein